MPVGLVERLVLGVGQQRQDAGRVEAGRAERGEVGGGRRRLEEADDVAEVEDDGADAHGFPPGARGIL